MNIKRYTPNDAPLWDAFVRGSRNGTFLFERAYMDYHQDRFQDHSLIFTDDKERIVALLPANERGTSFYSHQGLTYGGFILSAKTTSSDVFALFDTLIAYLCERGFEQLYYKAMPTIYHQAPAQEEEYVLWRLGATLDVCNLSCTIDLQDQALVLSPETSRRYRYNKLGREGYIVDWMASLEEFWPILTNNLQLKYEATPVHSLDEIVRLQQAFPDEILCCVVRDAEGVAQGGVVLFVSEQVAHAQYCSASPSGKKNGVLDYLYMSVLENYRLQQEIRYFDFGTSNEAGGRVLNDSLIAFKESFGGRGVTYKTWRLSIPANR